MDNKDVFFRILNQEMVYSTGCTEPAAISYTASIAATELKKVGDDIKTIKLIASKNILKNAMSAGLPNSDKIGVRYAAGIGALHGNPDKKLDVNNDVDAATYDKAEEMIKKGLITVEVAKVPNVLYIEIIINGNAHEARAIIKDSHTNVTLI
ncbi:MAG: serine dehydratase subunit alpha family protein, partial [Lachnospiraceae bacterium]|nr:serine dehydratase subunit alpha family protein [Lachnospiraceae bacterium]